jgi:putative ABC transport system permease protein
MSKLKNYLFLAIKNIRKRKLRSWLTLLGIFIGIAAVVSLISLGSGLQNAITGQFSTLGTDKLIVMNAETGFGPPGSTAIVKLNEHDVELIEGVSGVGEVIPRLLRIVSLEYNKITNYGYIVSMPEDSKKIDLIYETLNVEFYSGKQLKSEDYGKIVLGNDFAKNNFFDKEIYVGSNINIQGKSFEVAGILEPASSFQINSVILMLDSDLKELLSIGDEWDMIIIKVQEGYDVEKVAEDIEEKIRKDRHEKVGEESFSIQTPSQAIESVNTILNIINLVVVGIAFISLIVGGIGIANTMYTGVLERTREIGVMKAIGAKNKDILLIFLFESGLLGLIGGIIGALIGISLALGISNAANTALGTELLLVKISWPLLIGAVGFSFFVGIIAGVLPAIQASKLKPVEALRK